MPARLRDYALQVDAEYFVGRQEALAEADRLLDPDGDARVMLVHGPGGIGKSALLREVTRRAAALGFAVFPLDGRALAAAVDLLRSAGGVSRPLLVIDEAESLGANTVALRDVLLEVLPADARVIAADRMRPDVSWLDGVIEGPALEVALRPLDEAESRELLARRDLDAPASQDRILNWAGGSPLALTVAATSSPTEAAPDAADLSERLIQFLAGSEIDGVDPDVLRIAALTWAVDARLIAAALPDRSTRRAMPELLALSVTERVGNRVALHPLLAEAIRARLRLDQPGLARTLRRRIADHLTVRALDGDASAMHELTNLIEDPVVRRAVGLGVSATHYAEPVTSGAAPPPDVFVGTEWWAGLRPWVEALPMFATRIRRTDGALVGLAAYIPASAFPGWASSDPAVGPVLAYIAANGIDPSGALVGIAPHAPGAADPAELAEIVRVANTVLVTGSGMANPRYQFAPFWAGESAPTGFLTSMGFRIVPELGRIIDGGPIDTWVSDLGPGGVVGMVAAIVAAENGAPSPRHVDEDGGWLLEALREFHDDAAMAARGPEGLERAAAAAVARERLCAAVDSAFDSSPEDRRLRQVLELGYLTAGLTEAAVLGRLHLSRATYFRKLRAARERLLGRSRS